MKLSLAEISLKELRDFVETTDKHSSFNLSELSLVSLKLRLQLLIKKYKVGDFQNFRKLYDEDSQFKEKVQNEIIPMPNELFRDAENWLLLIKELKIILTNGNKVKIAICEPGKWADTITLLIALKEHGILEQTVLDVYPLRKQYQQMNTSFDLKELELGQINKSNFSNKELIANYFKKNETDYEFMDDFLAEIKIIPSFEKNIFSEEKYDVVIARNITIGYNFNVHEKIFKTYLDLLNKKGILFVGNRESFKWCGDYLQLSYKEKSIPIYHKK